LTIDSENIVNMVNMAEHSSTFIRLFSHY